jgi:hypothetical protein
MLTGSRTTRRLAKSKGGFCDPELAEWLRWAYESGDVSKFIRANAEDAFPADPAEFCGRQKLAPEGYLLFGGACMKQDSKVGTSSRYWRSVVRDHWQSQYKPS